ncbi:MAG: Hsp20/alpha crystallin family protein [Bacteroidales bacterium]|nr:Hsp20/alpha crystallin family protein [Bacteroidales bacterium]
MIKNSNLFPSIFDELFDSPSALRNEYRQMAKVNISETDKKYQIDLSAPGFDKKDFKIEVNDNTLTISNEQREEKKEEKKEDEKSYSRREFYYCNFSRSFILPETADSSKIGAEYKNGILEISIPKKEKVENPSRLINVK